MLRSMKQLQGDTVHATDGDIGTLDDCVFDDRRWVVRYLVVDPRGWLTWRVLVSPISVRRIDAERHTVDVSLTREQVKDAPQADPAIGVSPEWEQRYFAFYGYSPYWTGAELWGAAALPRALGTSATARPGDQPPLLAGEAKSAEREERRLHHARDVLGYHIAATDGDIGHVDDFLFDDETWAIRYIRVDTSNWIGGRAVIVAAEWLRDVHWLDGKIQVDLTREAVRNSPAYDPDLLNREYEARLYEHYGRRGYWE